jgi:phage-related protein
MKQWVGDAVNAVIGFLHKIPGPILAIVAPVLFLAEHWRGTWTVIQEAIHVAWSEIQATIGFIKTAVSDLAKAFDVVKDAIMAKWNALTKWFDSNSSEFKRVFDMIVEAVMFAVNMVKLEISILVGIIQTAWNLIVGVTRAVWPLVSAIIQIVVSEITVAVKIGLAILQGIFTVAWDLMRTVVSIAWDAIKAVIMVAIDIVKGIFQVGLDLITGHWQAAWNNLLSMLEGIWAAITGFVTSAIGGIVNLFGGIWGAVVSTLSSGFGAVVSFFTGIPGQIGHALSGLGDAISGAFSAGFNAVRGLWNSTVGKIHFTIPGWVPGLGGDSFGFPQMAEGGIVNSPTMALIGEAGPEAVIPLSRMGAPGMPGAGGGSQTYNITVNALGNSADPQAIVNALRSYIQRNGSLANAGVA